MRAACQAAAGVQAHVPAHQRDEQHVGAGRGLRQRDAGDELAVGQPLLVHHQVALHVRRGGDGAAHPHQ